MINLRRFGCKSLFCWKVQETYCHAWHEKISAMPIPRYQLTGSKKERLVPRVDVPGFRGPSTDNKQDGAGRQIENRLRGQVRRRTGGAAPWRHGYER